MVNLFPDVYIHYELTPTQGPNRQSRIHHKFLIHERVEDYSLEGWDVEEEGEFLGGDVAEEF